MKFFAIALILISTQANALALVKPTGNVVKDVQAAIHGPTKTATPVLPDLSSINADLQKVTKEVVDKAIADVQAALQDANNRKDQISAPCWQANLSFLQLLPIEWTPPPAEIGPALAFQVGRDLLNALNGDDAGSMKVACAAMWGDTLTIATQALAIIGIKAALPALGL